MASRAYLSYHLLACELDSSYYLEQITTLVTMFAVCLLSWALWITALVAYFANSAPSPSHPSQEVVHGRSQVREVSGAGWCLLLGLVPARLPWNLLVIPGIFMGIPPIFHGTGSQAHQLAMSLIIIINIMETAQVSACNTPCMTVTELLSMVSTICWR